MYIKKACIFIPASSGGSDDDYKKMTTETLSSNIRDAITNKFWTNYSDCKREVKWKTEEHRIGPAPRDEWKGNKIRYFLVSKVGLFKHRVLNYPPPDGNLGPCDFTSILAFKAFKLDW